MPPNTDTNVESEYAFLIIIRTTVHEQRVSDVQDVEQPMRGCRCEILHEVEQPMQGVSATLVSQSNCN